MMKSLLTAAAFATFAVPAASASGLYPTKVVTKKVTPVVAVSPRAVRNVRVVKRTPIVSLAIPGLRISTPAVKVVATPAVKVAATPTRIVTTPRRVVNTRNGRVIVR